MTRTNFARRSASNRSTRAARSGTHSLYRRLDDEEDEEYDVRPKRESALDYFDDEEE